MFLFERLPIEFLIAVVLTVLLSEFSKNMMKKLESKLNKEFKLIKHTKIIFVIFWSLSLTALVCVTKVYEWTSYPLYSFACLGLSITCYELILKKFKG